MSMDTVRMLVLETDEPHPDTHEEKGSFGEIFNELFRKAGNQHDPPLGIETDIHFVVESDNKGGHVPKAADIPKNIDAILITGSMYDAHGDDEWILKLIELIRELWTSRVGMQFSGVCFGHQVLSRALGSKVEATPGGEWELAHTEMDLTEAGQKLFRTDSNKLNLHQMHQDQVTTVPSNESSEGLIPENVKVHVWASTSHTKIQGLYIRDRLFTSQGHLGFDEKMVKRQVEMRVESGGIKDEKTAEGAKETAHLEHDGLIVAGAILRFFHGDDHDIE